VNIETNRTEGNLTVKIEGRLDSVSSGEFDKVLSGELQDEPLSLVIDMKRLDFISSKGLRVLVAAQKQLKGKKISIVNANNDIKEVLRISGLMRIFNIK